MRKLILTILILILIIPTFLPIAPHGAIHSLYDVHKLKHSESSHHDYIKPDIFHDHDNDNFHHEIPIDPATFYKDFLHVDLKNIDKQHFYSLIIDNGQDIDYDHLPQLSDNKLYVSTLVQKRGPPKVQTFNNNLSELFLNSRIRI